MNGTLATRTWPQRLLVIEDLPGRTAADPGRLQRIFGPAPYVRCRFHNGRLERLAASPELGELPADMDAAEFYTALFAAPNAPEQLLRLRNANWPLPDTYGEELTQALPPQRYGYALSCGNGYGLDDFFVERTSAAAFHALADMPGPLLLPNGCFNGLSLADGGRHAFSDVLQRYFLEEHFEELFPSPRALVVDAVNVCNYACGKCPFHAPGAAQHDGGALLSPRDFGRLLERCSGYRRLSSVAPTLTGEPLLHPHIVELARLSRDAGYGFSFTTNAALLTPQLADALVEAGTGALAFSLDAATPQTYRRLQGGDLAAVERNILYFRRSWQERHGSFTGTMSFVVSAENFGEQAAYLERWRERGFHVTFFARHDWRRHMRPSTRFLDTAPRRSPCLAAWKVLFLDPALRAVTCSLGSRRAPARGASLLESDPADFWRHTPGRLHFAAGGKLHPWCNACTCWAESHSSLIRTRDGDLVATSLGSKTFFPRTVQKG